MSSRTARRTAAKDPAPAKTGGKRARTRARLIAAAAELFRTHGIAAVSLDQIAAHADVTKGAIYGNFESKDDLVYAVAVHFGRRPRPVFRPDLPLGEQLADLVRSVSSSRSNAHKHLRFLTEIDLYVLTHEGAKRRMFQLAKERYREAAENLKKVVRPGQLPLEPLEFSIVVHALFNGLLFQRGIWPSVVTDDVVLKALKALAREK
jgi:AcrR family transcriptional regulator